MTAPPRARLLGALLFALLFCPPSAGADSLEDRLGRNEVRVRSASFPIVAGRTVTGYALPQRLEALGYRRVHRRPAEAGEFFWGHETFRIFRRGHRWKGRRHPPQRLELAVRREDGMITGLVLEGGERTPLDRRGLFRLEPETLAESLTGDRVPRIPIRLSDLPEHVWRSVLAAEDARFFDHVGVDGRAVARALLANVRAGKVEQGGSTITQQLVKNRDLSPKRSLGRKASEALRALALEAEHDKEEILEAYLNHVYLGHLQGRAMHGLGAASRLYFSSDAARLTRAQAALLAGMIQGPNRLAPQRHPKEAELRRNRVLERMEELGWASAEQTARAMAAPVGLRMQDRPEDRAPHFLRWVAGEVERRHARRLGRGRGVIVETTLDPHLQRLAAAEVRRWLTELRRRFPRMRRAGLSAALVALDAQNGDVLAHVGGDPSVGGDEFDRARSARRQPGSAIKPLLLLEAFESCGERRPLHPASRVADEPLRVDLPSGAWEPTNFDSRFRGVVDLREAMRDSTNVPFVRAAIWCGLPPVAARVRRCGLDLPQPAPPAFTLGAVETSPLRLAGAFTVFATPGRVLEPRAVIRVERPSGRRLSRDRPSQRRVVRPSTAYLIRELLRDAVERGTGRRAGLEGIETVGKTGTSSALRDAWFVGQAGGVVAAVWVGLDERGALGLTGSAGAAPLWKRFMARAVPARPPHSVERPEDVVARRIDPASGMIVPDASARGRLEVFRRDAQPPRRRLWRRSNPEPVIR